MRDFPSCFGENGIQVADASCSGVGATGKASQNLVTCTYRCKLLGKSCLMNFVWRKNLMGQCLSVEIDDLSHQLICKIVVKPSLFSKWKGSKCLEVNADKLEVFWDLSLAKFGTGPEPLERYYVAVVCKGEMVQVIGDLREEAVKKTGATTSISSCIFLSKREHIFGKKVYDTKAQFCSNGPIHDLKIECDMSGSNTPCLVIRIDAKTVIQVKHLEWKFRGNSTILVDGLPVEIFWDVHNWLFCSSLRNAVFMFQTCLSAEKIWKNSQKLSDPPELSWSQSFNDSKPGLGFSLFLYAWKTE